MTKIFILLNPFAKAGKSLHCWQKIHADIHNDAQQQLVKTSEDWEKKLIAALDNGTRIFIAAGGDGTVNQLINALIRNKKNYSLETIFLGAIGLGSSNDFHKPYMNKINGIPIKIKSQAARPRDIVLATYVDIDGYTQTHYFTVSSSIGLLAEANCFFNSKERLLLFLKRYHTSSAILYAALKTIFYFKPLNVSISFDGSEKYSKITSINILKTNYISGHFHLDIPIIANNGKFTIALLKNMGRLKIFNALFAVAKGSLTRKLQPLLYSTDNLTIKGEKPFALELDGEVIIANEVQFSLFHERIQECV